MGFSTVWVLVRVMCRKEVLQVQSQKHLTYIKKAPFPHKMQL